MEPVDQVPVDQVLEPSAPGAGAPDSTPAVQAVVIAHDPGPWFGDVLRALAAQDYPRLSVSIVDVASAKPLGPLVRRHFAAADVRRLDEDPGGFGASVGAVVDDSFRAPLLLLCHDDVALSPDAVSRLVEELLQSNGGIVGPKLVEWDEPSRLQHVGFSVDRFAFPQPVAEEGELDQEQHDAVNDVFVVPTACILVRGDLFRSIGGFDPGMTFRGDDVDLCWRAQLAGARVMVVPLAVGRHLERRAARSGSDDPRDIAKFDDDDHALALRHSLRTILSGYRGRTLLRVIPLAILLSVGEILICTVTGRFAHARDVVSAWVWNLRRLNEIGAKRRAAADFREVDDGELRDMQISGSARIRAFVRGHGRREDRFLAVSRAGRDMAANLRTPAARNRVAIGALMALVLVFGSRHLLTRPIPAIGELQPLTGSARDLLRDWWSGWHDVGGGVETPAPTGHGLLGLLGTLAFDHLALVRKVLALAPLVIGPAGAWRAARTFGSARASFVAALFYAATPVAYDAFAAGSLTALIVYAAVPWIFRSLARSLGTAPFGDHHTYRPFSFRVLSLGVLIAFVAAFVPFVVIVVAVVAVGLILGSLFAGDERGLAPMVFVTIAAVVVAAVMHLPWTDSLVREPRTWAPFGGPGTSAGGSHSFATLLRLSVGPFRPGLLGFAYVVPALLALFVAQGWRYSWVVRAWFVALTALMVQWAGERGWLPAALPHPGVLLSVAAFGLAIGAAGAVLAFEEDLRSYRLGWRQVVPFVTAAALVLAVVPIGRAAVDGRWGMPRQGLTSTLAFVDTAATRDGPLRVAWIGHRDVMPLSGSTFDADARDGVSADGDLVLALTDSRSPRFTDRWAPPLSPVAQRTADLLREAVSGETVRLGRSLAPLGIRYLVIAEETSPVGRRAGDGRPAPAELLRALDGQLDMERIQQVNDAVRMYVNKSWFPARAALAPGADANAQDDITGSPVLTERLGPASWQGPISADSEIFVATPFSERWQFDVDGAVVAPRVAFGYAMAFPSTPGTATLGYQTPGSRHEALLLQVGLWVAVIAVTLLWRDRLRRREASAERESS
ncbi:MAG TPA: glycosyltransferase [Acidimicrobiales bacterium]|nr:glycosyltransferase [Acidimicrobiales bacterium]